MKGDAMDWTDILEHAIPAAAVGIAFGFVAGFGLNASAGGEVVFWFASATFAVAIFCLVWIRREQRQHGGHLGGRQSRLEAFVPVVAGFLSYAASTLVFWKWQI